MTAPAINALSRLQLATLRFVYPGISPMIVEGLATRHTEVRIKMMALWWYSTAVKSVLFWADHLIWVGSVR